jgi:hypothetical protein
MKQDKVTTISDFVEVIKDVIHTLITANYEKATSEGWIDKQRMKNIVRAERESFWDKLSWPKPMVKPKGVPKGLYWLKVPPDKAIEEDIREGLIVEFPDDLKSDPRFSQFFVKKIAPISGTEYLAPNYDNNLHLGNVIDSGITPIPDMEVALIICLQYSLSLRLTGCVVNEMLSLEFEDLEIL